MADNDGDTDQRLGGEITEVASSPNLVQDHLDMAVLFAEKAQAIEGTYTSRAEMAEAAGESVEEIGDVLNDPVTAKQECRFYATGAVIAAAAFTEACINSLIYRGISTEGHPARLEMKNASVLEKIHDYTHISLFDYGTLNKYKLVLAIADKDLDTGGQVVENITLVYKLRNTLIHHQPAFDVLSDEEVEQRLGELYHKFDTSPLYPEGGLFFPYQCMSFDCARWAIEACLEFTEYFYSQVGAHKPYNIRETTFTIDLEHGET